MRTTGKLDASVRAAVAEAGTGTVEIGTGSGWKHIVFRLLAPVTALGALMLFIIGLMEVVFMWLPDATVVSTFDDISTADLVHRGHFNAIGIVSWAFVPVILVQLRKPERRAAAMLLAVAIVVAATTLYGLSGSLTDWLLEEMTLLIPVLLLAWTHPQARDLVRWPRFDRNMIRLGALAAVPWLVFAFTQAQSQWQNVAGDSHAGSEHWATSALMALTILSGALIGATDHRGWRLPAWIAALASIDYGLHSLVFSDVASAASTPWALAAVAWGCAYAAAILRRSRAAAHPEVVT